MTIPTSRRFLARLATRRAARAALLLPLGAALFASQPAQAANTGDVFKTTGTNDLSVGTNYTTTITPTAATTTDVQFSGSYTGTTFDANGTALSFGTLNDLDTTQSLVISNTNATAASLTLNTAANSTTGSAAADLLFVQAGANLTIQGGAGTLTLNFSNNGSIDNAGTLGLAGPLNIAAAKTITFTGAGATSVSGSFANTTGAVTVANPGGTVTFTGTNLYSGATTVSSGTLALNFSGAGAPATNIISGSSALTLGGGTLNIKGASGGTNTQAFASTTFTGNTSSILSFTQNSAASLGATLGGLTRGAGSTVDVTLPTTGTVSTTTTAANAGGSILVSSTGTGTAYATANGGTTFLANNSGTLSAYNGFVTGNANYTSTNNVDVTAGNTPASGSTVNTLRFNAANVGLTLAGANTLRNGAILVTPGSTGATITGGSLQPGSGTELVIHDYATLNVGSALTNGGATAALLTLTGTGTTTLSGANTYTGATSINGGTVLVNTAQNGTTSGAFGTGASALSLNRGVTLDLQGNNVSVGTATANKVGGANTILTSTGAATLTIAGGSDVSSLTVNGAASLLINGGSSLTTSAATLIAGTGSLGFQNNTGQVRDNNLQLNLGTNGTLLFNGAGQLQSTTGQTIAAGNKVVVNGAGNTYNFQGATTLNGTLTGAGTLSLDNGNAPTFTFAGDVSLLTGTLNFNSTNQTGTYALTNATGGGFAAARISLNPTSTGASIFQWAGTGATLTIQLGDLTSTSTSSAAVPVTLRNQGAANSVVTFQLGGLNVGSSTYGGVITNGTGTSQVTAITKVGTGTQTFSGANTYTGGTTVSGGALRVNNTTGSGTGTGTVMVNGASQAALATLGGGNGAASSGILSAAAGAASLQTYAPGAVGIISGATTIGSNGNLAPGNSVGTLTLSGGLTMASGSAATYEFNGTANDFTAVTGGTLTLNGGAFTLLLENSATAFSQVGTYNLFSYVGTLAGTGVGALSVANGNAANFTYTFVNDTTDKLIQLQIGSAVPEPSTYALFGLGLVGFGLRVARRRRAPVSVAA